LLLVVWLALPVAVGDLFIKMEGTISELEQQVICAALCATRSNSNPQERREASDKLEQWTSASNQTIIDTGCWEAYIK